MIHPVLARVDEVAAGAWEELEASALGGEVSAMNASVVSDKGSYRCKMDGSMMVMR